MLNIIGDMVDSFVDHYRGEMVTYKNPDMVGFEEYFQEEMKNFVFHLEEKDGLLGTYQEVTNEVIVDNVESGDTKTIIKPDFENFTNIHMYVREVNDIHKASNHTTKEIVFVPHPDQRRAKKELENALKHYRRCLKTRYENSIGRLITWDTNTKLVRPGDELGPVREL